MGKRAGDEACWVEGVGGGEDAAAAGDRWSLESEALGGAAAAAVAALRALFDMTRVKGPPPSVSSRGDGLARAGGAVAVDTADVGPTALAAARLGLARETARRESGVPSSMRSGLRR